ncbi:MAG TPA: hypothetical protein VHT03_03145 [Rhizomicrobium sp.]|jgi:hypothetical protein|nr:hypothetical protein [Rhizomicrobium sp.]
MPGYEIRYLNEDGELALIHKAHHENDAAVDRAAFRMLVGSGFADYEIWREDNGRARERRLLKGASRS